VASDFGLTTEVGSNTAFTRRSAYWGSQAHIPPSWALTILSFPPAQPFPLSAICFLLVWKFSSQGNLNRYYRGNLENTCAER